jgi:hypothetical protein
VWVSPPTYIGATAQDTIEARAVAVDASGTLTNVSPDWIPSDPDMVAVTPGRGTQVTISVKRAGESLLSVIAPEASKELRVQASAVGGAVAQVTISQ